LKRVFDLLHDGKMWTMAKSLDETGNPDFMNQEIAYPSVETECDGILIAMIIKEDLHRHDQGYDRSCRHHLACLKKLSSTIPSDEIPDVNR